MTAAIAIRSAWWAALAALLVCASAAAAPAPRASAPAAADTTQGEPEDEEEAAPAPEETPAQEPPAAGEETPEETGPRPELRIGELTPEAHASFRLDGRLDEAAWARTDSIVKLITIEPEEGGTPNGRTVVRVLASPDELIVGLHCIDDPAGIVAFSKARDSELDEEDHVLFVFDTFGDERSGYVFAINPLGSRFDGLVTATGTDVNSSWDAIWEGVATRLPDGWGAELRLPIKSLSFKRGLDRWGFNLERRVQRLQESSRWWGAKRDFEIFQTSQAGLLTGLPHFDFGLGLTVRPGLVADAKRPLPGMRRDYGSDVSLDANQKLGPNLTATVTVNTDFGETEADARQTNLSRFDVLFPEKRAFFLEGADIFDFGLGLDLENASVLPFFSRRIGLFTPEGEDEGTTVPLQAGGKLQGRIGRTNLGALVVGTDRVRSFGVPRAQMGAVRVRQNVLEESSVGMIATFGDPLDRRSWLGGADLTLRTSSFRDEKNLVAGVWGLTTERSGLTGDRHAFGGRVAYPNDLLDLGLTYMRIGDRFQPSLGFVTRTGHIVDVAAEYNPRPQASRIRQLSFGLNGFQASQLHGGWESYAASIRPLDLLFESGDRVSATIEPQGERPLEAFDVFGSPAKTIEIEPGTFEWTRYTLLVAAAPKRSVSGELAGAFGGFYRGDLSTVEGAIVLKPTDILTLHLTAERNVGTLPEGSFTQFLYGTRTELKFTPDFQVTSFVQYDNESRSVGSASRLRWTFHPLGDVFVAFNHNMARSITEVRRRWEFESDQFLVKVQYAWRL